MSEEYFDLLDENGNMVENNQEDLIMHPDEFPILFDWIERNILQN